MKSINFTFNLPKTWVSNRKAFCIFLQFALQLFGSIYSSLPPYLPPYLSEFLGIKYRWVCNNLLPINSSKFTNRLLLGDIP